MSSPFPIRRFVMTGASCAGKTSCELMLRQKLPAYGYRLLWLRELATDIITGGLEIPDMLREPEVWFRFQLQIARTQVERENAWLQFAELMSGPVVVVYDRAVCDNAGYVDPERMNSPHANLELFERLLGKLGLTYQQARDERYDAVFHLVTAAKGAEHAFNYANEARYETPEQARLLDNRLLEAWTGHRHLHIFGNTERGAEGEVVPVDFETKKERVLQAVCRELGLPVPMNVEHKYLLDSSAPLEDLPESTVVWDIEQIYLRPAADGAERRVRALHPLGQKPSSTLYVYTEKRDVPQGGRVRTERLLSEEEYLSFQNSAEPSMRPIRKRRHCFTWDDQYFQVDTFPGERGMRLLEVTTTEERMQVRLPHFLPVAREVSEDPAYRNAAIARR